MGKSISIPDKIFRIKVELDTAEAETKLENLKNNLEYRLITKEEYRKLFLNSLSANTINKATNNLINKNWNKLRKGYNFLIAVGKNKNPMLYSVPYFNKNILDSQRSK